jgi:hypothetical protein
MASAVVRCELVKPQFAKPYASSDWNKPCQRAKQSGLPSTIGSHHSDNLTAGEFRTDGVQYWLSPDFGRQLINVQVNHDAGPRAARQWP